MACCKVDYIIFCSETLGAKNYLQTSINKLVNPDREPHNLTTCTASSSQSYITKHKISSNPLSLTKLNGPSPHKLL